LDRRLIMKNYFLMLLFFCAGLSCLDKIDLEVPAGLTDAIVIEGKLVKGEPSFIQVNVQRIFDFDGSKDVLKVSEVDLIEEDGETFPLKKTSDGGFTQVFDRASGINISNDKKYKIRVVTFDNRIIESEFEEVNSSGVANDEITLSKESREIFNAELDRFESREKIILYLNSRISDIQQNPQRFRWTLQRGYKYSDSPDAYQLRNPDNPFEIAQPKTCYVIDEASLNNIVTFNGFDSEQDNFEFTDEIYNGTTNDHRFSDSLYFLINRETLSEGAFNYFDQISQVISRDGNMFEAPPGKIRSNYTNTNDPEDEIFGYFYATESSVTSIYVDPLFVSDPPNSQQCPVPPGEGWRPGRCPFTDCCDCLSIPGSSLDRPAFFN